MSLSDIKYANKKAKHEAKRKKLAPQHNYENRRMAAGDFLLAAGKRRRFVKNRNNHHRKMTGEHKRNAKVQAI